MTSLRACLRRGIGLTLCPEVSIAADLAEGRLTALPWTGFEPGNQEPTHPEAAALMIWHADRWRSPLLARFMDICTEVMREGTEEVRPAAESAGSLPAGS